MLRYVGLLIDSDILRHLRLDRGLSSKILQGSLHESWIACKTDIDDSTHVAQGHMAFVGTKTDEASIAPLVVSERAKLEKETVEWEVILEVVEKDLDWNKLVRPGALCKLWFIVYDVLKRVACGGRSRGAQHR